MKKIVILGADGYIGKNFIAYLDALHKYSIYAYVQGRQNMNVFNNCQNVVTNVFSLENIHQEYNPNIEKADCLFNFAWDGVATAYKNDIDKQTLNIEYSKHILTFITKHYISKYIALGSTSECVYGNTPITSTSLPMPCDMYSASKIAVKYLTEVYCKQNNIHCNWVRISSIYGPGRYDNNIIHYTIQALCSHKGTEFTPLEQLWDYIYIDDVCRGLEAIFLYGKPYIAYPLASGSSQPLVKYIEMIKKVLNNNDTLGIGALEYKLGKPDNCVVDMTETSRDTGFTCHYNFEEGIKRVIGSFLEDNNEQV